MVIRNFHAFGSVLVYEHDEEIGDYAQMITLDLPLVTAERIAEIRASGKLDIQQMRHIFTADHVLFSKHPGALQPPSRKCDNIVIDGEQMECWAAIGWRCEGCKRTFYVSARSQLAHGPCCEGADW